MVQTIQTSSRSGLIALNVVLLAIFAVISLVPTTEAQVPQTSQYIAVPGSVNSLNAGAVWILDTANGGELVAVTWDHNKNRIIALGYRSISYDAATAKED